MPAPSRRIEPWDVVYYLTDDEIVPADDFLDGCPTKVSAQFAAVLDDVAEAPPPRYSGGGRWEAMHGSMGGYYEVRAQGPKREQFRLFCILENGTPEEMTRRGLSRPTQAVGRRGVDESRCQRHHLFMSRLVASEHGLRALVALSQRPEGLRPAEVATILETPFSSAERALRVLEDDGLAEHRDRRFASLADARAGAAVRFALAMVEPVEALVVLARANRAVEFGGIDEQGAVLVIRRFAEPADEALLQDALVDLGALHGELRVELLDKSALRERLLDDRTPRDRALRMRILAGSPDRSFPDRTRHGDENAPLLRRLHDGVAVPSDRRLRALAQRHGLRRVVAFGSATRADFRPDSDLDLLVEPVPGHRLGLRQRAALTADAETLFERDVDLVATDEVRPALAERIRNEGVVLHGPPMNGKGLFA